MTTDPDNQLPTDPEWARNVDRLASAAAQELKCMVLLVAVQPDGKLVAQIDGVPKEGPLKEMSEDVPGMLVTLAYVCRKQDQAGMRGPKQ